MHRAFERRPYRRAVQVVRQPADVAVPAPVEPACAEPGDDAVPRDATARRTARDHRQSVSRPAAAGPQPRTRPASRAGVAGVRYPAADRGAQDRQLSSARRTGANRGGPARDGWAGSLRHARPGPDLLSDPQGLRPGRPAMEAPLYPGRAPDGQGPAGRPPAMGQRHAGAHAGRDRSGSAGNELEPHRADRGGRRRTECAGSAHRQGSEGHHAAPSADPLRPDRRARAHAHPAGESPAGQGGRRRYPPCHGRPAGTRTPGGRRGRSAVFALRPPDRPAAGRSPAAGQTERLHAGAHLAVPGRALALRPLRRQPADTRAQQPGVSHPGGRSAAPLRAAGHAVRRQRAGHRIHGIDAQAGPPARGLVAHAARAAGNGAPRPCRGRHDAHRLVQGRVRRAAPVQAHGARRPTHCGVPQRRLRLPEVGGGHADSRRARSHRGLAGRAQRTGHGRPTAARRRPAAGCQHDAAASADAFPA